MVIRTSKTFNTDIGDVKPGPHVDANGKHHPPVGTLSEMLERARYGNPPQPWTEKTQDRFIATLQAYPLFRESIQGVFRDQ